MPFKSEAQRKWMYKNEPEMAKQWEAETPKQAKLPEKATPSKPRRKKISKKLFGKM